MLANAVPLHKILNSNLQMIIPIFQRPYSWEKEQIRTLWEDIIKLYKNVDLNKSITHFLGPIVRVEISQSSVDTRKFFVIDGQQRITTLMILLACIRNIVKNKDETICRKIESGYLINYEEAEENKQKLIPSEKDKDNFKKIMDGNNNLSASRLKFTFDFFTDKLDDDSLDIEKLRGLIINNLMLVNIDVDRNENPYLIFESLNAKGTPLTQADLIRNYIFMKIEGEEKQKELYTNYWRPMENSLGTELESFFWRYSLKDGTFVKIKRTYANLKVELETNTQRNAEDELKKLYEYSIFYKKLIDPKKEENKEIRKRIIRQNSWEIRTAYPFLLNIYRDYNDKKITLEQFCEILDIIESFVVRRFICRDPTNKLNTLFIALYSKIDKNNYVKSLQDALLPDWPNNEQLNLYLKTSNIYWGKSDYILKRIELRHKHKEPIRFGDITVEHVVPQARGNAENLPQEWKEMLGPNYKEVYDQYLHTLANLTLTGYNSELSDKPFNQKKEWFKNSHLEMNKYFLNLDKWDEEEINKRFDVLYQYVIKIWKYPNIENAKNND